MRIKLIQIQIDITHLIFEKASVKLEAQRQKRGRRENQFTGATPLIFRKQASHKLEELSELLPMTLRKPTFLKHVCVTHTSYFQFINNILYLLKILNYLLINFIITKKKDEIHKHPWTIMQIVLLIKVIQSFHCVLKSKN